jgi:hypothetical protein
MHQGMTRRVGLEHRDDVDVDHPRELMTLLGEALNVFSKGFAQLLQVALQVPWAARPHIRAMEVVGEDLLEILLAFDDVSRQMIQLGSSQVS